MKFIAYYLKLEWKLINRKLKKVGFNLTLFWIVVPALFTLIALNLVQKDTISAWVLLGGFSLLFQVPRSKMHHNFLEANLGKLNIILIRITRNLLISIPLVILFLVFHKWQQIIALLVFAILFSNFRAPQLNYFAIPTPYRKFSFEFIIGFRRFFWIWLILPPAVWVGSAYDNYSIALVALSIVMIIQIQFYNVQEPVWYIWNESKTPSEFLFHKFKIGTICSTIANTIPVFFVGAILPESIWMVAALFMLALVMTIFSILSKYAWIPNQISTLQGILFACNLFFPPLLLFTIPYLYKKAENNLKNYLV
jgi:hypothetical protein